jgi:predicted DNA-binding transcriptional regulator AlpA
LTLLDYYPDISASYPEYVTQQQMCVICGIGKSTAYKAQKNGAVPFKKAVSRLVHTHRIRLTDVLAFKYKREYGYRSDANYASHLRQFYERRLKHFPDLLSVSDISVFTGFDQSSVQKWVAKEHLKAFVKGRGRGFRIPKEFFLNFLISPVYIKIQEKSEKQIFALKEFETWYAARIGGVEL